MILNPLVNYYYVVTLFIKKYLKTTLRKYIINHCFSIKVQGIKACFS